jgi:hypothetical protein
VRARHDGGRIVFEGSPADLVVARSTLWIIALPRGGADPLHAI